MKRAAVAFTIARPFDYVCKLDTYPVRVVIVHDSDMVLHRYNLAKGAKLSEPLRAYWCHLRQFRSELINHPPRLRRAVRGELCFSAFGFDPGLIAHESLHCIEDAMRDRAMIHHECGWEETRAYALQSIVGIIWRRGEPLARRLRA